MESSLKNKKVLAVILISNIIVSLLTLIVVKSSLNISKVGDFIQEKEGVGYIFLKTTTDPSEVLKDSKFDKCLTYGGIGVDLKSKDSDGYLVKAVLKEAPAAKFLKAGDKITSDLSIIRGRVGDPVKVYYKSKKNFISQYEDKEALMTLKPIKKCYLK